MTVLLVTSRDLPAGEPGAPALDAALAARGVDARWVVWDDPAVDWSAASLVAARSPWDYTERPSEFLAWAHGLDQSRRVLGRLLPLPNVSVKLSGLGFIDREWWEESMRPFALELIERLGPQRVLFASDFPTDKLFSSYDYILNFFVGISAGFSEGEQRAMWGRNANRVYRLGLHI